MSTAIKLDDHRNTREKNFFDFVLDASDKECAESIKGLKQQILSANAIELNHWFKERGYSVSIEQCSQIIIRKDQLPLFKETIKADGY